MAARDEIESLLDELEPRAQEKLLRAIEEIVDEGTLSAIADRLEAGDVEGAIQLVDAPASLFNDFATLVVTVAFGLAGSAFAARLPRLMTPDGLRKLARFDARSLRARTTTDQRQADLTSGLVRDLQQTLRDTFTEGLSSGRPPRKLALDAMGRIGRQSARRRGGVVGLSPEQAARVRRARAELSSGDPAMMRSYLVRALRDARLDGRVTRAMDAGGRLSDADVEMLVGRYAVALQKYRAEMIARSALQESLHEGQYEAARQIVESGAVPPGGVRKTWVTSGLPNTRHSHAALNGRSVGFEEPFRASGGALMYPGDRSLGASASEIVNCRCHALYRLAVNTASGRVRRIRAA